MAKYLNVQEALDDWITLFSNERCQYENFCEIWEGNKRVLVSNFYSVIEATKLQTVSVELRIAYEYIIRHCDKPKATMNATLVSRYQEELLLNNIHLDIGGGKTEPLVSTIKEYEATRLAKNKPKRISKGADDLIGKKFTSHSNPITIQDSTHYDFDVRICYEDKSATDWDVGIKSIRDWIEKGTLVPVPDKPKVDTGSDLIGRKFTSDTKLIIYTFDHINPDNRMVVSWVQPSGEISTVDYSIVNVRKHLSDSGTWVIKKPEPVKNAISDNGKSESSVEPSLIGLYITGIGDCTRVIEQGYSSKSFRCTNIHKSTDVKMFSKGALETALKHGDIKPVETQPVLKTEQEEWTPELIASSEAWQSYDANTETYSTKQEENIMTNPQTQIQVTVSTKAFATVKEFDTIYGRPVKEMNEGDLFNALRTIERDYKVLKDLDVKDSKRVKAQMTKLKKARGKVIAALDALPEDEDES